MSFMAGYLLGLEDGGGGSQTEEKYDRIAGLPTAFAFDIADGWRCELCADDNPTDCDKQFSSGYNGSDGNIPTITYSKFTRAFYLRIFSGSNLKLVSNTMSIHNSVAYVYADNGDSIGEFILTKILKYSDFSDLSVTEYNANRLNLPYIRLKSKYTITENDTTTTDTIVENTIISPQTKFISKNDIDVNVYVDFVKIIRKFVDEFNNNNTT